MKKNAFTYPLLAACLASSTYTLAQPYKKDYAPPSRGFFLEQGRVNSGDQVSVELHSGADNLEHGGGIRLGLPQAELIFNNGLTFNNGNSNDASLKWRLPPIKSGDQQTSEQFNWALITGLALVDFDNSNNDQTNIRLGLAATITADAATFTLAPSLVHSDIAENSDTFLELGFGAYAGVIDTESGLFSIGAELNITTQDDHDTSALLGARWSYNERINIDLIPVIFSNNDMLGLPGMIRLNALF